MSSIFKGFETKEITMKAEGVKPGDVVMPGEDLVASVPGEGNAFCGVCSAVRDGYASIIFGGYAETAYSGSAPVTGYAKLSSDGKGGVKLDEANGREYFVIASNETKSTVEFIVK